MHRLRRVAPDARREARLFNDPTNGYSVLVASDAIGLGLNLSIRRVIFTALSKFDGQVPGRSFRRR